MATSLMDGLVSFPRDPPLPPIGSTGAGIPSISAAAASSASIGGLAWSAGGLVDTSGAFNVNSTDTSLLDDSSFSSKLTNVEAQRIMSVLQEAQRKVRLIGMIPEVVDRKVTAIFGQDTVSVISEYRQLDQKYKQLKDAKDAGEKISDVELRETAKALRISTRTLCRHFFQNPANLSKLRFLNQNKSLPLSQFEQLLQEVKLIVYERLMTTVEQEKAKQDQLSIIIAKEQKTSAEVKSLKSELDKARKERSNEINKRNEVIRRLKEELREIKQQAEETTKRLESRSKQKEDQELQQAREKETAIQQDISNSQLNLLEAIKKDREEEAQWRKKKFKIESEVENWIHKYDQDMEEKQAELEDITAIYLEEKTQLDELQQRYNELQKEFEKIMDERRHIEELKKEEELHFQKMVAAAMRIQAIWRGFKVRRDLKKKTAAGKTEGKGGKKKK